jgi:hypothetical protein
MTEELTSANPDTNMPAKPTTNVSEMPIGDTPQGLNDNAQEQPNAKMPEQPIEGEQEVEFTEEELFDDEDYQLDFIKAWLEDPPLLPGEDRGEFEQMFESFEFFHNGRPKTVLEYMMVKQATSITWELMRYERMKVNILVYQGRSAAEAVYRKSYENLATEGEPKEFKNSVRKWTQHYFADPEYRAAYAAKLEAGGYGADAIEAEGFQRSLYSLSQLDRLIANLEKRLFGILKRLDEIYAGRHPQKKMNSAYQPLLPDEE